MEALLSFLPSGVQKLLVMTFFLKIQKCEIGSSLKGISHKKEVIISYQHRLKKVHIMHPRVFGSSSVSGDLAWKPEGGQFKSSTDQSVQSVLLRAPDCVAAPSLERLSPPVCKLYNGFRGRRLTYLNIV